MKDSGVYSRLFVMLIAVEFGYSNTGRTGEKFSIQRIIRLNENASMFYTAGDFYSFTRNFGSADIRLSSGIDEFKRPNLDIKMLEKSTYLDQG